MTAYIVLAVDSPAQAEMLVEDIRQNPLESLSTPHWGNRIAATVAGVLDRLPVELEPAADLIPLLAAPARGVAA